jgi:hypothetical protein
MDAHTLRIPFHPCWEWIGNLNNDGYGRISIGNVGHKAHRVAWSLVHGPIADGMCVLHRCDNRSCVRPSHLFLGTQADNNRDMAAKGRAKAGQIAFGEASRLSKLTSDAVRRIRTSAAPRRALAAEFGVTRYTIRDIQVGRSWRWLSGETQP